MRLNRGWINLCALTACLTLVTACGEKHGDSDGHDHVSKPAPEESNAGKEEHGEEEAAGASYEEGKGIALLPETEKSLGLEYAEVGEKNFQHHLSLTAQVYRSSGEPSLQYGRERMGNAYATALVTPEIGEQLKPGLKVNYLPKDRQGPLKVGTVLKMDQSQLPLLGKIEALLELPDPEKKLEVGAFVGVQIFPVDKSRDLISIPRSAVLTTSIGKFAFVKNGEYLLRTEIKTGKENPEFIEIKEGLYEGDTIATNPVEALYLIELRATKGGGHSH